jgi:hypothetical protein
MERWSEFTWNVANGLTFNFDSYGVRVKLIFWLTNNLSKCRVFAGAVLHGLANGIEIMGLTCET